jgi:hypothetical protein
VRIFGAPAPKTGQETARESAFFISGNAARRWQTVLLSNYAGCL